MLFGRVPVRYLPDDTHQLMRMVRRPKARSTSDLLWLRKSVGHGAGVDDPIKSQIFALTPYRPKSLLSIPNQIIQDCAAYQPAEILAPSSR
jgi:hypothetical protein